jgi:hypothetical protein
MERYRLLKQLGYIFTTRLQRVHIYLLFKSLFTSDFCTIFTLSYSTPPPPILNSVKFVQRTHQTLSALCHFPVPSVVYRMIAIVNFPTREHYTLSNSVILIAMVTELPGPVSTQGRVALSKWHTWHTWQTVQLSAPCAWHNNQHQGVQEDESNTKHQTPDCGEGAVKAKLYSFLT